MKDRLSHLQAYAGFFEALTPDDLARFDGLFSHDIHFKDPFNDVRGIKAVQRVFAHMFEQCVNPRFRVSDWCGSHESGYLSWTFHFTPKGQTSEQVVEGLSHVRFDTSGRVTEHIDYWDPAEQLYSHVPLWGWLFRSLRRRLSATDR